MVNVQVTHDYGKNSVVTGWYKKYEVIMLKRRPNQDWQVCLSGSVPCGSSLEEASQWLEAQQRAIEKAKSL